MAPNTPTVGGQLTQRDLEILAAAWNCFDSQPTINWDKLAEIAGFKNASSARACFLPIKKKVLGNTPASASGPSAPTASTTMFQGSGGIGRKKGASSSANDISKGRAKKAKIVDDDMDDDESNVKDEDEKAAVEAQIAANVAQLAADAAQMEADIKEYLDEGI
ncbi:hypothetical protein F5X99DRAFT_411269 [Biscogniauxia marginata]|nr:hypothetical protein F5X99DRAFT_411269 [Biscogniauxia marginata]